MVRKQYLVLIAAFVWFAAGVNILRIGLEASFAVRWEWWMILSAAAVFVLFGGMFFRIVGKHIRRIYGYDGTRKHLVFKFFDIKAYILMAVMMTGGILMRTFHWIPDRCCAMFYTGLGSGLACAGGLFGIKFMQNYLRERKMTMDRGLYQNYCKILQEELRPAMGCTEPIAVAYASAVARDLLGRAPQEALVAVSGNILKNVKSVVVPHTGGLRGIAAAVCAGVVAGIAEKQLEVISSVTDAQLQAIRERLECMPVRVELADTPHIFDIHVTLRAEGHSASVRILDHHTNIVCEEVDGKVLLQKECDAVLQGEMTDRNCLTVENIVRFANEVSLEDIKPILSRQVEYNMAIAEEGLRCPYGANIGKVLMHRAEKDIRTKACAYAAAGSDACAYSSSLNAGAIGAFMHAGVGIGLFRSFEEAYALFDTVDTVEPQPSNTAVYQEIVARYMEISDMLASMYQK